MRGRSDSPLLFGVMGVVGLIPCALIFWGLLALAYALPVPEWIAPAVGLLIVAVTAWSGSAVSGWLCGRFLTRRSDPIACLLANSATWVVLIWGVLAFSSEDVRGDQGVADTVVSIGLVCWLVGVAIAWGAARLTWARTCGLPTDHSGE